MPRKLQEVPGIIQGGIGWQGIVPARAAKMGSIAVDKAIAKLDTPAEFLQELEPDKIAEQMTVMFTPRVPEIVDQTMRREQPELWREQMLYEALRPAMDRAGPGHCGDWPEWRSDRASTTRSPRRSYARRTRTR